MRDCGKAYVYTDIVSFGIIVSFWFSINSAKGIFGLYATSPLTLEFADFFGIHDLIVFHIALESFRFVK